MSKAVEVQVVVVNKGVRRRVRSIRRPAQLDEDANDPVMEKVRLSAGHVVLLLSRALVEEYDERKAQRNRGS